MANSVEPDDHPDFVDYMDYVKKAEDERAADEDMFRRHQEWLDTSWGGWFVRSSRYIAKNPFTDAVLRSLKHQDEANTVAAIVIKNFVRLSIIFGIISMVYILGKIGQMIIGDEIIVEEEVIVVEKVPKSQAGTQIIGDKEKEKRRSARDKKEKVT
eukprot:CAMPEP_0185737004 /NCGR_PEP_ID=MMETSP1171-20130828/29422_1 /TAXON_ID=374046 /ORGANISM="Helicotheca tamensis, Strain CCMP826" /LENGTH=155 /DNA_ID=CAMNT_0028407803 /DNA_START=128 /DNA_END=595 /DNA_ORIENTATION=-